MRLRRVNPEECLNVLPRTRSEEYLYLYGRALVSQNDKRGYHGRFNVRDLLCVAMIDELTASVKGVGIGARYDAWGTEIFPGTRTLDEIGVIWVEKIMRSKGIGSAIFKHMLHSLASKQDSKWIYFQAFHPRIRHMANQVLRVTSVPCEKYVRGMRTDFCLDVRNPEERIRLADFLKEDVSRYK